MAMWKGGFLLGEPDRRRIKDRRSKPTPLLSRYTFWGRRSHFRREEDQRRGGYVDRYHPGLLFLFTLIIGLNILDALFTMGIIEVGGYEVNPVVNSVWGIFGDKFWIWKFGLVSFCVILLCIHIRFRLVKAFTFGIALIYIGVILYQVILFYFILW